MGVGGPVLAQAGLVENDSLWERGAQAGVSEARLAQPHAEQQNERGQEQSDTLSPFEDDTASCSGSTRSHNRLSHPTSIRNIVFMVSANSRGLSSSGVMRAVQAALW